MISLKAPAKQIPLRDALLWIFLSVLLISGPPLAAWFYYVPRKRQLHSDEQYRIEAIVQTTPQKEALKTVYLAELMRLSIDKPANLYQFDSAKAEKLLLNSPVIRKAKIKKIPPSTLYIDYEMRTPVVYLGDYQNAALDAEGVLIPVSPFFTPKRIPIFYLGTGSQEKKWGDTLDEEKIRLAFEVWEAAQPYFGQVKQVDVSKASAESYGERQIILVAEPHQELGGSGQLLLRLSSMDYLRNLEEYMTLEGYLRDQGRPLPDRAIIDFRLSQLAFISS